MERQIIQKLMDWKKSGNRKPLILKGVRQCGKTHSLKEFGNRAFKKTHYLNFEKNAKLSELFEENLDPKRIIKEICFLFNTEVDILNDLVVFDEIQACPKALTSLKYFNEEMSELALCSAGSLLGIHLNPGSFPVGNVDLMDMYPLSFTEFLLAINETRSLDEINHCNSSHQLSELVHQHIWERLKWYFIVGGLPEAVLEFTQYQDHLFTAFTRVREKQTTLMFAYYADIAKHAGKVNAMHIDRVFRSAASQLAKSQDQSSKKFKFKDIVPGIDRYSRLADAIDWLVTAGLVIKIPIITKPEIPLSAYTHDGIFKLYLFDVGMLSAMSDIPAKAILDYNYGTYKGYFAENFIALELGHYNSILKPNQIFCWQEGRTEVEFVTTIGNDIIPIEVKSGNVVKAQALSTYCKKFHPIYRVVMSGRNVLIDAQNAIHQYPLYLASRFPFST